MTIGPPISRVQRRAKGHEALSPITKPVDSAVVRLGDTARSEYRIVLATMPLPAKPMETYTGLERPGTVTLRRSIEYAGEVAGQAVRPWRARQ
jgi:hypothetical protein